ncbi:MAG: acyltransferase [Candidatus Rokuibacteriota bacterium]|nr:MAG: acyltransferase [Candidatus Rokubacteria bacterium]
MTRGNADEAERHHRPAAQVILTVIPTRDELDAFVEGCRAQGHHDEPAVVGRLPITRFPELAMAVACGGLGKVQFGIRTQHLLDSGRWRLVVCAGAAGALVSDLSVGDVVIATETVEHDILNRFGAPRLPRFGGSAPILEHCRRALRTDPPVRVHYGPVASGDEDVVDVERRAAIHERTRALVVAWEGAGGARASQFSGVEFVEVRGVTDGADGSAAHDFARNVRRAMTSVALVVTALVRWAGDRHDETRRGAAQEKGAP